MLQLLGARLVGLLHFGVEMWYGEIIHLGRMALLGWRARRFVSLFYLILCLEELP